MGIVNCTPDSFFPGSRHGGIDSGLKMLDEGADWLDIGGQSTRPGSEPVPLEEELRRVVPVVKALAKKAVVSVDTDKAEVAKQAREAGAKILNDVTALRGDPGMLAEAGKFDKVIVMHMLGTSPKTMQNEPSYGDAVAEIKEFLKQRASLLGEKALIDPGIGFGKTLEHNLSLLKHLDEFAAIAPVVLGASRKSFIGKITPDSGPEARLEGSLAAAVWGARAGVAAVRVHDVAATRRALDVISAIEGAA